MTHDPSYIPLETLRRIPSQIVFDIRARNADLLPHLYRHEPALARICEEISYSIPIPNRSVIEKEERFYRLANHNRSFCLALARAENVFCSPCVVFKGVEPLFDDFNRMVDWMMLSPFRNSVRVMAEHFPLAEGKIPGAVSLMEAISEANLAAEIQAKHHENYGEFARLPMPLAVHQFSEEHREQCRATLTTKVPPVIGSRVEQLIQAGLGVYIYYYPVAPIRADAYGTMGTPQMRAYLSKLCSPQTTISRWIRLLARLIHLGYLPATPRCEGLGACMDLGNSCLDGGFCDIESVQPISSCPDDEFFYESIIGTLYTMLSTIEKVAAPTAAFERSGLYPNIEKFVLMRHICEQFERALDSESRPYLPLDPRVKRFLSPKSIDSVLKLIHRKQRPRSLALYLRESNHKGSDAQEPTCETR